MLLRHHGGGRRRLRHRCRGGDQAGLSRSHRRSRAPCRRTASHAPGLPGCALTARAPGPLRRCRADLQDAHRVRLQDRPFYQARKVWRGLNRQGRVVARCTVERLVREMGVQGAVCGKRVITTLPGWQVGRARGRLDHDSVAAAPNRCWAADFTAGWSAGRRPLLMAQGTPGHGSSHRRRPAASRRPVRRRRARHAPGSFVTASAVGGCVAVPGALGLRAWSRGVRRGRGLRSQPRSWARSSR
ncbi:IS3 family transposase [Streptomyces seoulensis]|nr:IS3 family transposase [Streptomyces seoulensis]